MNLDELQRLAEEANAEAEGDWFCADLLEPGAPDISASVKARRFMHAFDPDTAKKLIAVAQWAEALLNPPRMVDGYHQRKRRQADEAALRTALEELK